MTVTPEPGIYTVLGASGLVGSHALVALKELPDITVRAVYHSREPAIKGSNITPIKADLTDPAVCRDVVAGTDYLLIFAGMLATAPVLARDPVGPVFTNLRIVSNALEAAWNSAVRKCVWLSSTTGYPAVEETLDETRMFEGDPPESWYGIGWMTRYVETLCRMFSEKLPRKMPVIVLRPSMIYGEYDHFDESIAHFLPSMIRRIVQREKPIEIWGTGEQTRDVIHASDVFQCALLGLAKLDEYAAFNVVSGQSHSVNDFVSMIAELDKYVDFEVAHVLDRPTTISRRQFDGSNAKEILSFSPQVSLSDGIQRTLNWYRKTLTFGEKPG